MLVRHAAFLSRYMVVTGGMTENQRAYGCPFGEVTLWMQSDVVELDQASRKRMAHTSFSPGTELTQSEQCDKWNVQNEAVVTYVVAN